MNFSALVARAGSPSTGSRAPSPSRAAKRPAEDGAKIEKASRRYASNIEKTLATWEIAPEEWADYIAFLSRLIRAIQTGSANQPDLPHSDIVSSKLAQCLNPALPSGVHQKALEVYSYIFSTFGNEHVAAHLHEYLPGLFSLLSFAALSVRPALYDLLEEHVVCLQPSQLRPVLKSSILSLLPALEDETSEDFDRALTTVTRLEHTFIRYDGPDDYASFYWQSVFLAIITSPARRQGALNYLVRRLPKFTKPKKGNSADSLSPDAEICVSPEPGLLIRAFNCGLTDSQMLIQRGFLDILVTHLPLDSPLFHDRVDQKDFQLLVSAATSVLLRRDMSLNRRIWQWFLGPEAKEDNTDASGSTRQLQYFASYGSAGLETCMLSAFATDTKRPSDRARPFRIGLSLMDRWEIGGDIIPKVFLAAMECSFRYSKTASQAETSDLLKSASLFFDGIESKLIWSKLYYLLSSADQDHVNDNKQLLLWILANFNVREVEMTTMHAPLLTLYTMDHIVESQDAMDLSTSARWHTIVNALLDIIDIRTFTQASVELSLPEQSQIKTVIDDYYSATTSTGSETTMPYDSETLNHMLMAKAHKMLIVALQIHATDRVPIVSSTFIHLLQKLSGMTESMLSALLESMQKFVAEMLPQNTSYTTLHSIVSLLTALDTSPQANKHTLSNAFVSLEHALAPALLRSISPTKPKNNVEATRLLWRLDTIHEEEAVVQVALQSLVTDNTLGTRKDSLRTFLNLWNLSVSQPTTTSKSSMPSMLRRSSGLVVALEHDKSQRRIQVLSAPLLVVLETLSDAADIVFEDVNIWLNSSIHTESAIAVLFDQLRYALDACRTTEPVYDTKRAERQRSNGARLLTYTLQHFDNILRHAQPTFWAVLIGTQLSGARPDLKQTALSMLTEQCLTLLPGSKGCGAQTSFMALSILNRILTAPQFVQAAIRMHDPGAIVLKRLSDCIASQEAHVQVSLLELTVKALKWQQTYSKSVPASSMMPSRASTHARKMSLVASPPLPTVSESQTYETVPVQLLVQVLKAGLSSPTCFPYLDSWLQFTEEVLPMLGSTITTVLIPMVESICRQVQQVFNALVSLSVEVAPGDVFAPENTIAKLLDGLEIILRSAHHLLLEDDSATEDTQTDTTSTVLSNMTPNMFKSQGPPSKTAKANNRLTAILASKDVVRICITIWLWASNISESAEIDRSSAATTAHSALRLRNKARHMLEEIFSLEPLESLEVIAASWVSEQSQTRRDTVISLLHVLRVLQPKNTVPAILDALCSRTNPSILVPARQSTLTSELTSADLVLFYSAYLASLEDDALDEIWSDCNAFLKDVLANPLPYRQILPALIWIVFQLAQKLEHTNYGERKRMRRELGDSFQRLLAATFAALPVGSIESHDASREHETSFSQGLRDMNLVVILREVIGKADTILETADRVSSCISTISTNLVTPSLRSKTFPTRLSADMLGLVLRTAKKSPAAKAWRKDVSDAFNDTRFISITPGIVERHWFPILQQWSSTDKERMNELVARLYAPTSAGIMFGVGASAARLDADKKTQLNLRRIALLLMACPQDSHVEHTKIVQEKIVELFEASTTSSPSSAIKAELFMLLRALLLSTSAIHFASLWPILNDNLRAALLSLNIEQGQAAQNNLSLLQACKLLDVLAALSPDEFQLYEWVYLTNTTDAVYHKTDWHSIALSDNLGQSHNGLPVEDGVEKQDTDVPAQVEGLRAPMLVRGAGYDTEDLKAMAQDHFVNTALRPFLSQMSINLYESRYRLDQADVAAFRHVLIQDLQDPGTMVT